MDGHVALTRPLLGGQGKKRHSKGRENGREGCPLTFGREKETVLSKGKALKSQGQR